MSGTPFMRPFSGACERNKAPILARLEKLLAGSSHVLEIGSGTGQHAVHFARAMPWLRWTCSDLPARHAGIRAALNAFELENLAGPLALDVLAPWPAIHVDAVFSANIAHIMPWPAVMKTFDGVGSLLPAGGRFVLYGPFHYGGEPTSDGNAAFDRDLHSRGDGEGIRDSEAIQSLAVENALRLIADCAMPANNRLLAWEKTT